MRLPVQEESRMPEGRCLCGALRFEADPPFQFMVNCHCSMCRKHHGSAFATFIAVPPAAFRWISGEANVGVYASSESAARAFCRVCGSVAPHLLPAIGQIIIPAGNLEGDLGVTPQMHIFAGSRAPWHEITDELPRSEAYPPGFDAPAIDRPRVTPRAGVVEGSCLCGDVAYEMRGAPLYMWNCHCSRCRRAPERSARHERVLPSRCVPLGARRDAGRRVRTALRRVISARRSADAAAAGCRACPRLADSSSCRRERWMSIRESARSGTSTRVRRPRGSRSPAIFRSTTSCRRLLSAPRSLGRCACSPTLGIW
jgi:hypothetical protein